jgi:Helix-turn-helix domain
LETPEDDLSEIEGVRYQPVPAGIDEYLLGSTSLQRGASGICGWITERQLADKLDLSLATVRRWRRRGYGPKSVRIGRRDFYREDAVERFAADQLAKAERELEGAGRGRRRAR